MDDLAPFIQHTLIHRGVASADVDAQVAECLEHGFDAAMVAPPWVALARRRLAGSAVKVASAVDFPLGVMTTAGRVAETRALVEAGAHELDVGVGLGWLRSGEHVRFRDDLAAVVRAAGPVPVKAMLELPLLTDDERERAVELALDAGVAWLKNASSGDVGTADPADVAFLARRAVGGVRVKASGRIERAEQVRELLAAGAQLVGTSAGVAIVTGRAPAAAAAY